MLIDFSRLTPDERQRLFNGPALAPPDGVVPNLENPPNNNTAGRAILTICVMISTVVVLNRFCARFVFSRPRLPDYLMMIAYALFLALIAIVYRLINEDGIFVHQWNIRLGDTPNYLKYTFHSATVFSTLMGTVKAAILIDWMRIFVPHGTRNFMFWACHFFLWVNIIFAIAMVVTNNIACVPYEYNYNKLISGSCHVVDQSRTNLASSIFNLVMDVVVFFLPQKAIWQLTMSRKKKFGVSMVFMTGLAAIVATGIRLGITVINIQSEDYTYTFSAVMMCALGEAVCGFIILCGITFPKTTSLVMESKWITSIKASSQRFSDRKNMQQPRPNLVVSSSDGMTPQGKSAWRYQTTGTVQV